MEKLYDIIQQQQLFNLKLREGREFRCFDSVHLYRAFSFYQEMGLVEQDEEGGRMITKDVEGRLSKAGGLGRMNWSRLQ